MRFKFLIMVAIAATLNACSSQTADGVNWGTVWSAATVVLTLGLLIATGVYAWLTYRLVNASEQHSWEVSRPRLLIALRANQGGQFFILHIENVGLTSAEEVQLTLDQPVHQQFGRADDIQNVPVFKEGLRSFPPRTPIQIGLGVGFSYLGSEVDRSKHPLSFKVTATYKSGARVITEKFPIDVRQQYDATLLRRDYVEDFARNFPDKMSKDMRELIRLLRDRLK